MLSSVVAKNKCTVVTVILLSTISAPRAEILPSSSAVLIPAGKDESTIDIKNTGSNSVLLYSKIDRLPDDDLAGGTLFANPQAIVMVPGETQSIRIIYKTNTPDNKEHIARIIFTGLPPKEDADTGKVKIVIGQDLPVVIGVRKDLQQKDIWQRITFHTIDNKLCMLNPTAKVFRFAPEMYTDEMNITLTFSKAYLLPGEKLCTAAAQPLTKGMHLNLTSVSDYNYRLKAQKIIL